MSYPSNLDRLPLSPCPHCNKHEPQVILSGSARFCNGCMSQFSTKIDRPRRRKMLDKKYGRR